MTLGMESVVISLQSNSEISTCGLMENSVSKHSLPAVLEYCGPTIAWKTIPRGHRTTNHVPRILMYWKEATYSLGECCRMLWHMFGEQRVWGIQPFRMLFWNHARGNSIVFTGFPAFCFTARQKIIIVMMIITIMIIRIILIIIIIVKILHPPGISFKKKLQQFPLPLSEISPWLRNWDPQRCTPRPCHPGHAMLSKVVRFGNNGESDTKMAR